MSLCNLYVLVAQQCMILVFIFAGKITRLITYFVKLYYHIQRYIAPKKYSFAVRPCMVLNSSIVNFRGPIFFEKINSVKLGPLLSFVYTFPQPTPSKPKSRCYSNGACASSQPVRIKNSKWCFDIIIWVFLYNSDLHGVFMQLMCACGTAVYVIRIY